MNIKGKIEQSKRWLFSGKNNRYRKSRLRDFESCPSELSVYSKEKYYVEVPMQKCRTNLFGFPLLESPFVQALQEYASGKTVGYEGSLLENFYMTCQPDFMSDVLSLENETMRKIPAMGTVLPWWNVDPEACLAMKAHNPKASKLLGKEAVSFGLDAKNNYGWQFFGPVSPEVGELEFRRLTSVYENIQTQGYQFKKSGGIHGEFLITDDDWVWVGQGGKHRMAALAALGWKVIPATTKGKYGSSFIRREEVKLWPHVVSGLFSETEALKVFDSILNNK